MELLRKQRASGAQVVVRATELHGQRQMDVRLYHPDTSAGPGLPTDDGITLTEAEWQELLGELGWARRPVAEVVAEGDPFGDPGTGETPARIA
jgi:Transcriptional Coactivator p15 (PC4)